MSKDNKGQVKSEEIKIFPQKQYSEQEIRALIIGGPTKRKQIFYQSFSDENGQQRKQTTKALKQLDLQSQENFITDLKSYRNQHRDYLDINLMVETYQQYHKQRKAQYKTETIDFNQIIQPFFEFDDFLKQTEDESSIGQQQAKMFIQAFQQTLISLQLKQPESWRFFKDILIVVGTVLGISIAIATIFFNQAGQICLYFVLGIFVIIFLYIYRNEFKERLCSYCRSIIVKQSRIEKQIEQHPYNEDYEPSNGDPTKIKLQ